MPSVVEDFAFIAKRAQEIRAARYQELGVSPPGSAEPPRDPARLSAAAQSDCGGFRYAPGFEYLAEAPRDDRDGKAAG
jgi:hypothetical protein